MVDLSANAQSGENNTASDILVASKSTEVPQLPPAFDEHPRLQLSGHSLATACKKKQKRTKADRAPKPPKMSKKDKKKVPVARDREFGAEGAVTGEIREVPARGKSSMPLPLNKIGKKSNEIAAGALIERRTENMEHANLPKFDGNSSGKEITALENTSSTNVPEQLEDRSQREVTTASNSDPRVSDLSEGRISDSSSFCTNAKRRRIESRNNRFATGANAVQPVDAAQFGQKHSASARNNRPVEARLTDADASESRSRNSSSNSKHIYFDNVAETRLPPRESSQRRSDENRTSDGWTHETDSQRHGTDVADDSALRKKPRLPWHKRTPENNIRASEVNFSFKIPKPGDEQNKPPNAPQKSRTLVCRLCSQEVAEDYVDRRQHVIGKHLKCDFDERIRETLSSEIRRCFPGCLVYCDEQVN
ncbi:unnamed protein product [Gongylonema pulchrum]|uniref:Zf-C2H2_3 domain-containing protein n=1 Tax=Gongylonema pulchrum TaxID=637853 RepID=A0A183EHS6_9BILA|nr:unnamed protein product [Gongylonema pulchrum]